jgi:hypothetical protein
MYNVMRATAAALAVLSLGASAFAPSGSSFLHRSSSRSSSSSTSALLRSSTTTAAAEPPVIRKEAPGAGWVPDWEDRPGLSPEEFMRTDESKPDLSGMWECPLTRWDYEG